MQVRYKQIDSSVLAEWQALRPTTLRNLSGCVFQRVPHKTTTNMLTNCNRVFRHEVLKQGLGADKGLAKAEAERRQRELGADSGIGTGPGTASSSGAGQATVVERRGADDRGRSHRRRAYKPSGRSGHSIRSSPQVGKTEMLERSGTPSWPRK